MKMITIAILIACGGESTVVEVAPQPMPPPPATVVAQAPVEDGAPGPMNAGENWMGRYLCAQGPTDLDLRIDAVTGSTIDATFIFAHGPSGAAGSYKMRGTLAPDGSLVLVPGPWVARPANYVSVGMSGVVRGAVYAGRMDNPSCTTFSLTRERQ
jgi:hypothetical protein